MQKFNLKQYSSFLILGILFIVLFKVFDPSWFSTILNAFYPVIIGAVLAYFLDPIVKIIARLLNKSQNSFCIYWVNFVVDTIIKLVDSYYDGLCSGVN